MLFSAVTEEVARLFEPAAVTLAGTSADVCTVLAATGIGFPVGSRWPLDVDSLAARVYTAGRPVHVANYADIAGARRAKLWEGHPSESDLGVPIVVDGSLWGVFCVATPELDRNPSETAERIGRFTRARRDRGFERDDAAPSLLASRARVIAAADETRRRIERDLHDGAQQQLVTLALGLRSAEGRVPAGLEDLRTEVGRFADRLTSVIEELREMSRGIHPAILTEGGLSPAVEALALRSLGPGQAQRTLRAPAPRRDRGGCLLRGLGSAHERREARRRLPCADRSPRRGGNALSLDLSTTAWEEPDPSGGSGLIGLKDRVEALGGTIEVASPPGSGTRLDVEIPLLADPSVASNPDRLSPV